MSVGKDPQPQWVDQVRRGLKSQTFANTGWTAISTIANGLVGAISSAILARFLGIGDFGTLTLVISLLNLVTDVADFGLSSAIVKFGSPALEQSDIPKFRLITSVVLRLKLFLGLAVVILSLIFLNPIISYLFHHVDEQVTFYFQLSLLAAALALLGGIYPPILQAHKFFRSFSAVNSSRYVSKLVLLVCCILFVSRWSVELGIWIEIGSALCFLLVGYWLSPVKQLSLRLHDDSVRRQVVQFNKWISVHQIIMLFGGRADLFFVGGLTGATALGLYGAASKIAGVIQVSTYSYHSALLPEFSAAPSHDAIEQQRRSSAFIGFLLVAGIGLVALLAEPVLVLLFGAAYADAGEILQVMSIGLAFNVLAHPFMATLFAMDGSAALPIVSGLSMIVFISCNAILVPYLGAMGAAAAYSAGWFTTFVSAYGLSRWWRKNRRQEMADRRRE